MSPIRDEKEIVVIIGAGGDGGASLQMSHSVSGDDGGDGAHRSQGAGGDGGDGGDGAHRSQGAGGDGGASLQMSHSVSGDDGGGDGGIHRSQITGVSPQISQSVFTSTA